MPIYPGITVPEVLFRVTFTYNLPPGLVVATPSEFTGSCGGGTISAQAGGTVIALSGAILQPRTPCTFSINVFARGEGLQNNTVTVSDTPSGIAGNTASASLHAGNLLSKAFGAQFININGVTSLTITLTNITATLLTGMAFSDGLPVGLAAMADKSLINACGGTLRVDATALISVAGVNLAPGASCVVSMNVVGKSPGVKNKQTSAVSTVQGVVGAPAMASIAVSPNTEPVLAPTLGQKFGAAGILINGQTTLTFTLANPNPFYPLTGIAFTDILPPGLIVASPNALASDCGGPISAPSGSTALLTNATSVVTATESGPGLQAVATIFVVNALDPVRPPLLTQAFGSEFVNLDASTSLTFTLRNPNALTLLNGIGFSEPLPAGLTIATPSGLTTDCGGVAVAPAGTETISLASVSLAPFGVCTLALRVKGVSGGAQTSTTSEVTSLEGGSGPAAVAAIMVRTIIDSDAVQVGYASSLPGGDSVINLTNTGTLTLPGNVETSGNICVNIYTFDTDEELMTCCSCLGLVRGICG